MNRVTQGKRPDIQALRGAAVLAVMLAHFGSLVPAGFLGVDLFFSISGFVITLSFIALLRATPNKTRALRQFWWRRLWRLLPALSVVLTVTVLAAFFLLPPSEFEDQAEMTIWSFFFAGNIGVEVISQPDYFDPAAKYNWLLHLWSLGVEEQFYLLFPWIMIAVLARASQNRSGTLSLSLLALGTAASFAVANLNDTEAAIGVSTFFADTTGVSALTGYYSPLTRAWQFGIGIIAALALHNKKSARVTSRWPSSIGLVLLVVSFLVIPESNLLPGPLTLIPMTGMYLLLRFPHSSLENPRRLLQPLVWLGNRSYSAYLWHWPIWSVLTLLLEPSPVVVAAAFVSTMFLADRTYVLVEKPFISWSKRNVPVKPLKLANKVRNSYRRIGLVLTPLLLVAAIQLSFSLLTSSGAIIKREPVPRTDAGIDCIKTDCTTAEVDVLVVGDSHAGTLTNALSQRLDSEGLSTYGAIVARHFGCPHLPSTAVSSVFEKCNELAAQVRQIASSTRPEFVVIYGYTAGRFTTINSGGEQEISLVDTETGTPVTDLTSVEAYRKALQESVSFFTELGSKVVVVSGTPDFSLRPEEVGQDGQEASIYELMLSPFTGQHSGQTVTREEFTQRHGQFVAVEKAVLNSTSDAEWVDSWSALCDATACSQVTENGQLLYSDQDHLSAYGAERLANYIAIGLEIRT
jgi:peptidoglycan/LPS O-acetylase OafA/YrhL